MTQTALRIEATKQQPDRYSTTAEPRTPTTPSSPNGHGGVVLRASTLTEVDDDVFVDEKLKQNNNDLPHFAPPPRTPGTAPSPDITWSQRTLRTRHVLLVAAAVVSVVVIAVGVALVIVFTQSESSKSSSSSQTTTSPPSTTVSSVITYSGNLQLQSPWNGTTEELRDNLSQDFASIVSNSTLQEFYIGSSLQSWSHGTKDVSFQLDFKQDVTSLSQQSELSVVIQDTLRELVKQRDTNLDIIPETIVISENIPDTSTTAPTISSTTTTTQSTTTSPTTTTQSTTKSTTTVPLPEECLPLTFSVCQGLGYTHFSLPNLLGTDTENMAVDDFYFLANSSLDSGCTSDPTLFCGFAFPPCSHDEIQTLPCLDTCRATVQGCVEYLPFPLECEGFPATPPCLQSPFPVPNTTTTTVKPDACTPQMFERCRKLGFNSTSYPTWFGDNEADNIRAFETYGMPTITADCHPQAEFFICAMFFPKCNEEFDNVTLPCRSLCQDVEDRCYSNGAVFNIDCAIFDTDKSKCLLPVVQTSAAPITTTTSTTTSTTTTKTSKVTPSQSLTPNIEHRCEPISIEACRHFGHVNGSLPSSWGAHSQEESLDLYYQLVVPVVSTGCDASALFYLCAMLFPRCDDNQYLYPCSNVCEEYNRRCAGAPEFFNQTCSALYNKTVDPQCLEPPKKTECAADEFACEGAPLCVPSSALCNNRNDCGDWSDERDCTCSEFEFRCKMGMCIRNHKRCDGENNCPDHSDEYGCTSCKKNQFKCDDNSCIMAEWVCDGQTDCEDGEDELNCTICPMEQYVCVSGECLPSDRRCDGVPDCKDHSDEASCIYEGSTDRNMPMFLNVMGDVYPVCLDQFSKQHADTACHRFGYNDAIKWSGIEFGYNNYFQVFNDSTFGIASIIGQGTFIGRCDQVVGDITCAPAECGHSELFPHAVIGGEDAKLGEIPWQASIQEFGKHFCGGSLIHPYFVVTAAHCVDKYMTYNYLRVVLGAVDFSKPEEGRKRYQVKRIINHPKYFPFEGNDIALVELTEEVKYSDDIKPICLRNRNDVFTRASYCFVSGWGKTDPEATQMATHLQRLKMTLWDTGKCNSSFSWDGQILQTEICAGYYSGIKSACHGDSGGPLFCRDLDYRWRLVGVASYVHQGCNKPEKPVVFSDAVLFNTWIANNTACRFKCGNGRCLFDSRMVCDKVDDCGDNSDEIDQCDISTNCTFDDPYLCGYRSYWLWVSEALTPNSYPLFDHTYGRYPGMFLLAPFRGKFIHTPRVDLTSPHCFRFRYHIRGAVRQGLNAQAHELSQSGKWSIVWNRENFEGADQWMMGQFNLDPGNYDIVFTAYDDGRATMDDFELLPGLCKNQGCGAGEFACTTSGQPNCLPRGVLCNTVIDCDDAADEKDCTAATYTCDFENGLLCGLRQDSYDTFKTEWQLLNTSKAGISDLTFGDDTGHVLKIITERLLPTDQVRMHQDLYLGGREHCIAFSFWSTSTVRMEINFQPEGSSDSNLLWSIENRQTTDWSPTQATIPAAVEGQLTYTVIGRDLGFSAIHPMVAIDDLSITAGPCAEFQCAAGQSKCSSEAYCIRDSQFCDRDINCRGGEDESSCKCTDKEFKCTNGPCISLEHTCDSFRDCPEGDDEGTICDHLRSASCNFEDKFMCGYTHNATDEDSAYLWSRETEGPINVGTGPWDDHTFQNGSGHYALANGERGHPYDYVALESPPFASNGNGILTFYYHAQSTFAQFNLPTGTLDLVIKNLETGSGTVPWSIKPDGNHTWRSACIQLPKANKLSVAFVAMRERQHKADMAVDDVAVRQMTCDQFYLDSRLQTGVATQPPPPPETGSTGCKPSEFQCRNGMCIDKALSCNGMGDCVDSSDEFDCATSTPPPSN